LAAISREELIRLARAGAIARVNELRAELETIYGTFPDLRTGTTRGRAPKAATAAAPAVRKSSDKANRAWSAAARKAVSERMKKYWATRRAKTAKAAK